MATLPAGFAKPPKPPPASVPITDTAWIQYFNDLYQWQIKLVAALS